LLWPEIVFGTLWVALLALTHTLFTDDDMWQHRLIDGLQWVVFAGYVIAAFGGQRRQPSLDPTD
jgi:hypothetical protein